VSVNLSSPAVSVVLPTYNREDVVGRAIESVLEQSYRDFELIVVDDGSTDDTAAVVRSFDDPRVAFLEYEENSGAPAARNTGIREAAGEFIAFQDSDDEWHPEKLEKQMEVFADAPPSVGVVYTGFTRVGEETETYHPGPGVDPKEGDVHQSLLRQNFVTTQAAVVRAQCFEDVGGFDERLPRFQDWELWIRISREYAFKLVDQSLVTAYDRPDSISNDLDALVEARKVIIGKHADDFGREQLAKQLFGLGHSSLKARRAGGRRYLARAVRTDPSPLYAGCLLVSLFGPNVYNCVYRLYRKA
jgi:glycosyltransferase involved in cell wall biosynthesis